MRLEPSWRQPFGILLILVWIAIWSVVAGLAWILPLKPLLRWMELGKWRE